MIINMFKKKYRKGMYFDQSTHSWRKASTADRALKIAKSARKAVRQTREVAISDDNAVTGTLNATTVVTHVIPSTSPSVELEGTSAILKSVRVRGFIKAGSAVPENYRFDIVLDRRPTPGTVATAAQIYFDASSCTTPVHQNYITRFKVLRSYTGWVNTASNGGIFFDAYLKLNLRINTIGQADYTSTSQNKNAILIVHRTDATGSQPTYNYTVRTAILDN